MTIGISSYNFRNHVASDIGVNQSYVDSSHLQSQISIDKINRWTTENKMKLNEKKTNIMIFNYTNNYQFATRIKINETILETLEQTKLLGVMISSDLTWRENTKMLIRKAYGRMEIIRKLYKFNISIGDLVKIYIIYIRCLLEQSCVVWSSSITEEETANLERVQKVLNLQRIV